ncbi:MAG: hypothetical protein DRP02_13105 [Candidatus Gerdarchaeota archaeon]|nr:MAG: hypothetical protein DRP02_13105 [Candidatus Gerdarchaeota archaeon]
MRPGRVAGIGLAAFLSFVAAGGCSRNNAKNMQMAGTGTSVAGRLAESPALGYMGMGASVLGKLMELTAEKEIEPPVKYHLPDPPAEITEGIFAIVNRSYGSFDADMSGFDIVEGSVRNNEDVWLCARAVNRSGGGYLTHAYRDGKLISNGYHVIGRGHKPPEEADVFFLIRPISTQGLEPGRYRLEFLTAATEFDVVGSEK